MSKSRMYLSTAKGIADKVIELLRPHCERIEIAGSIRRQQDIIGDIEIVLIPKPYETGLFTSGIASVVNEWTKIKGELEYGKTKYTQRMLPTSIIGIEGKSVALDLFFAENDNWGNIFLIRTGDWEFSKKFMGTIVPQKGYKQEDGYLKFNNKIIPCPEEKDLFLRMGIKYIEPKKRNVNAI
jgi:DNA polymerase/3'-5' exonuclease PolX